MKPEQHFKSARLWACALSILFVTLLPNSLRAHDVPVHEIITKYAVASAAQSPLGYQQFYKLIAPAGIGRPQLSDGFSPRSPYGWIVFGSSNEDWNVNVSVDIGGYRSYNHFYNPLGSALSQGLSNWPRDNDIGPMGQAVQSARRHGYELAGSFDRPCDNQWLRGFHGYEHRQPGQGFLSSVGTLIGTIVRAKTWLEKLPQFLFIIR